MIFSEVSQFPKTLVAAGVSATCEGTTIGLVCGALAN